MKGERDVNPPRHLSRIEPVVATVMALFLLTLSTPQVMAAFYALPGDLIVHDLRSGAHLSERKLTSLVWSRERAAEWVEVAQHHSDRGLVYLIMAGQKGYQTPEGNELLKKSRDATLAGLTRSPFNGFAWHRLAQAELARADSPPDIEMVSAAIVLSARYTPYNPRLLFPRLAMILDDQRLTIPDSVVRDQFCAAHVIDKKRLESVIEKRRVGVEWLGLRVSDCEWERGEEGA